MKRFFCILLITILLLFSFGCGQSFPSPAGETETPSVTASTGTDSDSAGGLTLTDMLGRSIYVHEPPERIVSLCPTVTELLFALNKGDALVGVDIGSDYPAEVMSVAKMGGGDAPDVAAILEARPDVVFVGNDTSDETLTALEGAGLSVVYAEAATYPDIVSSISLIARITGADAGALISQIQADMARLERLASARNPQSVFYIAAVDDMGIHSVNRNHYISSLMDMAGGTVVVSEEEAISPVYTMEDMLALNPQVILVSSAVDMTLLYADPAFAASNAALQGLVYALDAELISRPGPRVTLALEQTCTCMERAQLG